MNVEKPGTSFFRILDGGVDTEIIIKKEKTKISQIALRFFLKVLVLIYF